MTPLAASSVAIRAQSPTSKRNPSTKENTEVNKGSINMGRFQSNLNDKRVKGYRLAHIFEQDGNTVMVFEWIGQQ